VRAPAGHWKRFVLGASGCGTEGRLCGMNILCLQALSLALALALSLALEGEGEGLKAQDVFGSAAGSPKFLAKFSL
jgi:hypothetical protein